MKTLFVTASAAALMLGAAACSDPAAPAQTAGYETAGPQAEMVDETDDQMVETADAEVDASDRVEYTLADGEIEASDLIGASVHDAAGEEIATVADIHLGGNGMDNTILVRDGGVSGLGGDLRVLAFDAATMTATDDAGEEPNVVIAMTEGELETLPMFEQDEMNDYRLASEMMGAVPAISFSGDQARVNDLILTASGDVRYAVISPGLVTTEQIVVDADAIKVAEGDSEGELTIDIDQAAFNEAPKYRWE